jgi:hypothetical protein
MLKGMPAAKILASSYERLRHFMGATAFDEMAHAFARSLPDGFQSPDKFLDELPDFLKRTPAFSGRPELAEFATLERSLHIACTSSDTGAVKLSDLANIDPQAFACAVFTIQGSLTSHRFATNVTSLWASLRCGVAPPKASLLQEPVDVIVWRQTNAARFRIVGPEEADVLDRARKGEAFGNICERIAENGDGGTAAARAAGYLRGWIDAELVAAVSIEPGCG